MLVFLGGTVGKNRWREERIIPALTAMGVSEESLFNPVVEDWDKAAQEREDEVKHTADCMLFVITNPYTPNNEVSAYSLVEAVMALYDDPTRTVVVLDDSELSPHVAKAMKKSLQDLRNRFPYAPIFESVEEVIPWLATHLLAS